MSLLGFGTVASGVPFLLKENHEKSPRQLKMKSRSLRSWFVMMLRRKNCNAGHDYNFVTNVDEIIEDKDIAIVVELMGRIEPAKTFITRALEAGKHVVSANKDLLAVHGSELLEIAQNTKWLFIMKLP